MKNTTILGLLATAGFSQAAILVDGTLDSDYGSALATQSVETQFGDSAGGFSGGGELDAAYARVQGGRLFVMLTGNIEPNFNKVSIFIDSKAGGENTLVSQDYDFGNVANNLAGLTFDSGFAADYHLFGRWGGGAFELEFVDRDNGSTTPTVFEGDASTGSGTAVQSGTISGTTIDFGFNNNNSAGVAGGTAAADQIAAAAVTTGLEFSIDLADLGSPTGDIRIFAGYGNGDHNFWSNQILGGLPADTGNLGGDGAGGFTGNSGGVDFNNYGGDQFFTVTVPEPSTALLGGLALLGLLQRRR
ncbi:MAG: PEP-CTERM sorting domain-containing protein [Verrucomicrobiota bacterium]